MVMPTAHSLALTSASHFFGLVLTLLASRGLRWSVRVVLSNAHHDTIACMDLDRPSMAELQEAAYGADRDYTFGSPHLAHASIRTRIEAELGALVKAQIQKHGECAALEVGAGHGTFTDALLSAGARVTVTEMSEPSAAFLRRRYSGRHDITVVYDREGTEGPRLAADHDLVVMVSVLHHIPDYVGAVRGLVAPLPTGGAFYCTQDPLWYPSRSRLSLAADRGAYFAWRLRQGSYARGLATRARRVRGVYDETKAGDMVEYHVVRQGVDQHALVAVLSEKFSQVELLQYWSTQSALLQRLGDRLGWASSFGITATEGGVAS